MLLTRRDRQHHTTREGAPRTNGWARKSEEDSTSFLPKPSLVTRYTWLRGGEHSGNQLSLDRGTISRRDREQSRPQCHPQPFLAILPAEPSSPDSCLLSRHSKIVAPLTLAPSTDSAPATPALAPAAPLGSVLAGTGQPSPVPWLFTCLSPPSRLEPCSGAVFNPPTHLAPPRTCVWTWDGWLPLRSCAADVPGRAPSLCSVPSPLATPWEGETVRPPHGSDPGAGWAPGLAWEPPRSAPSPPENATERGVITGLSRRLLFCRVERFLGYCLQINK